MLWSFAHPYCVFHQQSITYISIEMCCSYSQCNGHGGNAKPQMAGSEMWPALDITLFRVIKLAYCRQNSLVWETAFEISLVAINSLYHQFNHIFVFIASFSALWWPNIWPKMGFPKLFEKTIGSIHFIPGIYPYGVSFLTPIQFRVPSLFFGPLVAKYLAENGVSGIFLKNCWFHSLHTWHLPSG